MAVWSCGPFRCCQEALYKCAFVCAEGTPPHIRAHEVLCIRAHEHTTVGVLLERERERERDHRCLIEMFPSLPSSYLNGIWFQCQPKTWTPLVSQQPPLLATHAGTSSQDRWLVHVRGSQGRGLETPSHYLYNNTDSHLSIFMHNS